MSILAVDPHAAWYVKAAAEAVLVLHIGGGGMGMVSGGAALVVRKGGRLHALTGRVFFMSMLCMSGIGAAVSLMMKEPPNVIAGVMTFYLVLSSWVAIRRKSGRIGAFEVCGFAVALGVATAGTVYIDKAMHSPAGTVGGSSPQDFYIYVLVGSVAAASDLKVILRRGVSGASRIARHLWRMCSALAIALGSFFFGQAQFVPASIRDSPLPQALVFTPLILLVFWSIRVRFKKPLLPRRTDGEDAARTVTKFVRPRREDVSLPTT